MRLLRLKRILALLLLLLLIVLFTGLTYEVFRLRTQQRRGREMLELEKQRTYMKIHDLVQELNSHKDISAAKDKLEQISDMLKDNLKVKSNGKRLSCGENVPSDKQVVCNEQYFSAGYSSIWKIEESECMVKHPAWNDLMTVILFPNQLVSLSGLKKNFLDAYPGVNLVLATVDKSGIEYQGENVRVIRATSWNALVKNVKTPYVIIGRDLHSISSLAMFHRSLRLLQDPGIGVVGGATRNLTGHWQTDCHQADIRNYHLHLLPGYRESSCDCMQCSVILDAPFATRTELLQSFPLNTNLNDKTVFFSWFLHLQRDGYQTLLCPDILYQTHSDAPNRFDKNDWLSLAKLHQFQAVTTDHSPRVASSFTCDQVDLQCSPRSQQSQAILLPWCCLNSYAHMLRHMERLAVKFNFHYELDSGSTLGAVKLGNFIPWDIDGDLYLQTAAMPLFQPGGTVMKELELVGITAYRYSRDNYSDKGAGYFLMWHGGVDIEMMGKRGNLTLDIVSEFGGIPTRVLVAGTWVRTHANPGSYARARYGPGYLKHAQSWRYEGMKDSGQSYKSGAGWKYCEDPTFHACLEKYPIDGNVEFSYGNFKEWESKIDV